MDRATLKAKAKESLKGKYGDAIAMIIIYGAINYICGFVLGLICGLLNMADPTVDLLSSILSLVLSGLFMFGYNSYFLKLSRNEEVTYKELFNKKDLLVPYIVITLLTGLFTFLWSLLFIIPGIIAAISYSFVYFVKLDNPELSAMDVLRKSKEMLNGHKMDYFVLSFSFLGWEILGIFTLGILYLWLTPYMSVTFANFYNKLKEV